MFYRLDYVIILTEKWTSQFYFYRRGKPNFTYRVFILIAKYFVRWLLGFETLALPLVDFYDETAKCGDKKTQYSKVNCDLLVH